MLRWVSARILGSAPTLLAGDPIVVAVKIRAVTRVSAVKGSCTCFASLLATREADRSRSGLGCWSRGSGLFSRFLLGFDDGLLRDRLRLRRLLGGRARVRACSIVCVSVFLFERIDA